jgi:hypothetical protein
LQARGIDGNTAALVTVEGKFSITDEEKSIFGVSSKRDFDQKGDVDGQSREIQYQENS